MSMTDAKTQTFITFIRHHREQPRSVGFDADGAERWQAILAKLEQLIQPVATEVNTVMNDLTLTQEGQRQKLMAIGPRVVNNFKNLGVVLSEADKAKARLETVLFAPITTKPTGDAVVTFLREDAIRRTVGKAQAGTELLLATERGDIETMRALLDWPGRPMIAEDIKKRAFDAYAQKTNPTAWEKLRFIEVLRDNLEVLATQTAQWLRHLGATPEAIAQAVKD